ncbi:Methyltransferase domain-containing protein [Azospirillum oryzae]|uniref:Methyltransferase domain-containing protein n=2 Tax=Azospirillum oryzae TaxID=286727 RepID=A0A1X7HT02_9PROT|nr:Methyltransferase domain-containing protein [Azospirillum oryzae]
MSESDDRIVSIKLRDFQMLLGNYQYRDSRIDYAFKLLDDRLQKTRHWLKASREVASFTYDITEESLRAMVGLAASVCGVGIVEAEAYFSELLEDSDFLDKISKAKGECKYANELDETAKPGHRMFLYAIARIKKPKIVVEAGPFRGFGSVFLIEAIRRNDLDGFPGEIFTVDIMNAFDGDIVEACGYGAFRKVRVGDATEFIENFEEKIDIFLSETHYSGGYGKQLKAIEGKLQQGGVITMSALDDELYNFSKMFGRRYASFYTEAVNHIYQGQFCCVSY